MSPTNLYWSRYRIDLQTSAGVSATEFLMDISCGNAEQLRYLRNARYRAIGLELAPEAARARGSATA